jgi:hypothetical protein
MRIKIVHRPHASSIDGIRLGRFEPGYQYEVGSALGAVMLAEGWATPVAGDEPPLAVPFSETDSLAPPAYQDDDAPVNLVREHYPPYLEARPDIAFEFQRRRKRRSKT